MKCIKWIKITLKLGICYIVRKKKVNNETNSVPKKGWIEEEGPLN